MPQTGPYAPAAPFGPKSFKLGHYLNYQIAKAKTTQVPLLDVLILLFVALIAGFAIATYAPELTQTYRANIAKLLKV